MTSHSDVEDKLNAQLKLIKILAEKKLENQVFKAREAASENKPLKVSKSKLSKKPMVDNLNKIAKWLKHFEKQDSYSRVKSDCYNLGGIGKTRRCSNLLKHLLTSVTT